MKQVEFHTNSVNCCAFSNDDRFFATASSDKYS